MILCRSVKTPNSDNNWQTFCTLQTFVTQLLDNYYHSVGQCKSCCLAPDINILTYLLTLPNSRLDSGQLDLRVAAFTGSLGHKRDGWETEGEHLKRWRTFGALKDDIRRIKPSWELMVHSRSTALARSSKCLFHALSRAGPGNRGAPRSVVLGLLISSLVNDWSRVSLAC